MSKEKQRQLAEINRPMNEELFNSIEKQYKEIARVKAESEQIEEIRKDIFNAFGGYAKWEEDWQSLAEAVYSAGYRKQSEGVWKLTTEPLGAHEVDCVECSVCGESWVLDEDFDYDVVKDFWSFCPNCGAKMKGGAE